jgi:hypothetical protein
LEEEVVDKDQLISKVVLGFLHEVVYEVGVLLLELNVEDVVPILGELVDPLRDERVVFDETNTGMLEQGAPEVLEDLDRIEHLIRLEQFLEALVIAVENCECPTNIIKDFLGPQNIDYSEEELLIPEQIVDIRESEYVGVKNVLRGNEIQDVVLATLRKNLVHGLQVALCKGVINNEFLTFGDGYYIAESSNIGRIHTEFATSWEIEEELNSFGCVRVQSDVMVLGVIDRFNGNRPRRNLN